MPHKNNIWFFYPSGSRLTGQELASRLILELLRDDIDLNFRIVQLAAFDRERRWSAQHWFQFFASTVYACYQMLMTGVNRNAIVYLNLGQSMKSLLSEGVPFGLSGMLNSRRRSVISLHGHFFMEWSPMSIRGKLFRWTLTHSRKVTVLGLSQKEKLIGWGMPQEKIQIVNNTCEGFIEGLPEKKTSSSAINLLYFGNLIKAKGYREYLMALLLLSGMNLHIRVYAVMCGQFTKTSLYRRGTCTDPVEWTNEIIERINKSLSVRVCWTQGAYDDEKAKVFGEADILVFPSYYRVEAQPIVLIEGLAAGCAIIASSVGEIPAMLADGAGKCLKDCSPENLANSIYDLLNNPERLQDRQTAARAKFEAQYSRRVYANTWRHIFRELAKNTQN
jgi:glycosyltransferase involved in cell wall biosynthesis